MMLLNENLLNSSA